MFSFLFFNIFVSSFVCSFYFFLLRYLFIKFYFSKMNRIEIIWFTNSTSFRRNIFVWQQFSCHSFFCYFSHSHPIMFSFPFIPLFSEDIFTPSDIMDTANSPIFLNRLLLNHKKLCVHKGTTVILMNDYSIPEVDQLLCSVLGLQICPPRVASMVHKLSGGNPFWCKEMALFILTTGAGELFLYLLLVFFSVLFCFFFLET